MKSPWPTKKLGEILQKYFSGVWGESPQKQKNLVRVIRVSDIEEDLSLNYEGTPSRTISLKNLDKYILRTGDIVVVKSSGSKTRIISGRAAYFEEQTNQVFIPSNFVLTLRVSQDKAIPKFVWYFLITDEVKDYVKGIVEGTTYPNLNISQYLNLPIPLPSLSEQQKIVYVLDSIKEGISAQEKIIEKTKELKRAMMADLFKYGGPSFRKGRKLKKTEIGEIPEDWEVKELGNVVIIDRGVSWRSKDEAESGLRVISIPNISDEKIDLEKSITYLSISLKEIKNLKKDDILLVGSSGSLEHLGRSAMVLEDFSIPTTFASFLLRIRPVSDVMVNYVSALLESSYINFERCSRRSSDGKYNLQASELKLEKIPLPSLEEQKEIAKILQMFDQKIEIEQKKKALYEELFKTMLNKLMSGEIKIDNFSFEEK